MPSKSIFRGPDALHFQLVHRSQRDPLIHDPEASQQVLKPFHRENDIRKGKSRADLESLLTPSELAHDAGRANIGEASLYGVYYDDTNYDYMQHLRDPNVEEEGVETIMIEAPSRVSKAKTKEKTRGGIELRLPPEVLPSSSELDRSQAYDAQQAIPDAIAGFQPDMDPHLRQVLEALEEDAFVDDKLDDDFFGDLVRDGERSDEEQLPYEFREEGIDEGDTGVQDDRRDDADPELVESWETRFARFKDQHKHGPGDVDASEADGFSESADTVGRLPVIGGKKRRRGAASASSGFSMTSSAVYRNEGLSTLDERYDQIEKDYEDEEDDMPDDYEDSDEDDEAPDLLAARDDFEAVMDDFLENYELVGKRMRPVLSGDTAAQKLDTIRRALGGMRVNPGIGDDADDDEDIPMPHDVDEKKDRWDCETILSTYSNLENHPRLIRAKEGRPVPSIRLHPRTGIPSTEVSHEQTRAERTDDDRNEDEDEDDRMVQATVSRPRNESKEEKKARKQAVKQERQVRRLEKKANRQQYATERKRQVVVLANKTPSGTKKL
ncbi:Low temperature viability protein-domain-containing protein [Gautieria morchelliformis]|nr:Low temperature viability protein-domain-containing protein [Gautieria morchelliformis]